ncbi:MAG: hypothetical protein D6820_08575 [Lentisphaerae bacterium]|nr:MAG: hypothetical protein D6820_08575 [Lentisphaerota bacterium]
MSNGSKNKSFLIVCLLAIFMVGGNFGSTLMAQCCGGGSIKPSAEKAEAKQCPVVTICPKCGEIKGSAKCCKDAPKCPKCGLHKGSPGCCKIPAKQ